MLARISRGNEVAGVIAERKKDVLCVGNWELIVWCDGGILYISHIPNDRHTLGERKGEGKGKETGQSLFKFKGVKANEERQQHRRHDRQDSSKEDNPIARRRRRRNKRKHFHLQCNARKRKPTNQLFTNKSCFLNSARSNTSCCLQSSRSSLKRWVPTNQQNKHANRHLFFLKKKKKGKNFHEPITNQDVGAFFFPQKCKPIQDKEYLGPIIREIEKEKKERVELDNLVVKR